MNPQTKAEAERVLTVLDETLNELELMSWLPAFYGNIAKEDLRYLKEIRDEDMGQLLSHHYDVERKLETGMDPGEVSAHQNTTVGVVTGLKRAGYGDTYIPNGQQNESVIRFQKVIEILRGLMHNNFSTTVEEDDQKLQILRDTVSREQHASADVKALNREFITERKLRQTEVLNKDQAIHKLIEELEEVERKAHEDITDYERIAQEKQLLEEQQASQDEQELEQKVSALETELSKLKEANQKDESAFRADRKRKENNLSTIINDYDKEMTQKAAEKEKLQKEHEVDSIQLAKVEEELKQYEEENARWMEEDQVKMDRLKHKAVIKLRLEDSAKTVQAFWRGFVERNNLKKKAKKGKGKKK